MTLIEAHSKLSGQPLESAKNANSLAMDAGHRLMAAYVGREGVLLIGVNCVQRRSLALLRIQYAATLKCCILWRWPGVGVLWCQSVW
jgi:hypothetical protein